MPVFEDRDFDGHEQVVFAHDPETGLRGIIAIHNTSRGPALGGCRFWNYAAEQEAVRDVLRLSRGMTYKNAMAGLPLGGGKSVIIGDASKIKTPALMTAMGRAVDRLGGRYIIAEDVGTTVEDMEAIRLATSHVAGVATGGGDPSPLTAYGVFQGIRAAVEHRLGRRDLEGIKVAVQGLGHVGEHLCRHLAESGARLFVTDIRPENVERIVARHGAVPVRPDEIYGLDVDVYAPCALGATINDETVPRLKAAIVAGAANNQLAEDRHGAELARRGILYAPDYVINAGGVINILYELDGGRYDRDKAYEHTGRIHETAMEIFEKAAREGVPTNFAADRIAEERFRAS
jgi:leucine dehydrogenase